MAPSRGPIPNGRASQLIDQLRDAARVIQDTVIVCGYLAQSDLLTRADKFAAGPAVNQMQVVPARVDARLPWRIYLSPRLDCYVEFEPDDVVAFEQGQSPDNADVYIVWLKNKTYTVTAQGPLKVTGGFVRGELVDDFLSQADSRNVVWEEQQYGPTSGKSSNRYCVG